MTEETTQEAPKQTNKDRFDSLDQKVNDLETRLTNLTEAIRKSAHVMGWPSDLLERHGIKAFDKLTESTRS